MVSTETLEVVMRLRDELTQKVNDINNKLKSTGDAGKQAMDKTKNATNTANTALNQQSTRIDQLKQKYDGLKNSVTNAFNSIKNAIKNSSIGQAVSQSSLAKPFLNAAESIKQKWSSMTEYLKSKIKGVSNEKVGFNISNTGLKTLNGEIATTTTKTTALGNAIIKVGQYAPNLGSKLGTAFTTASTKIDGFKSKINSLGSKLSTLTSGLSGVQSAIMGAFGALGVTSLTQFTIGAAATRDKINAVTTALTGSREATEKLNSAMKNAVSGGVIGFNTLASAIQQTGIKYGLTNEQLEKAAPVLANVGNLARAMGKDTTTAATIMSKAYDGLNGNFMLLKRNLGITKEQLIDAGWSGAASDVDGYTMALQKVLETKPELQEYFNSYEGQMERLKMSIQGVGRSIGEIVLPVLQAVLGWFLELHKQAPWLTTAIVGIGIAILGVISVLGMLAPVLMTIEALSISLSAILWPLLIVAAIIALIAVLKHLYDTNEQVRAVMDRIGNLIRGTLTKAWDNLQKIVAPLSATFNHLMQVLGRLGNDLLGLFGITGEAAQNFDWLSAIINVLGLALNAVIQHITMVVQIAAAVLIPLISFIINLISNLVNFILSICEAVSLLMQGDVIGFITTLGTALWSLIVNTVMNFGQMFLELLNNLDVIFGGILSSVWNWATQFVNDVIQAGLNAVNGFIQWISTLPAQLWAWLLNTANKILIWRQGVIDKIKEVAKGIVDGFKQKIASLPQIMWDELVNIKNKILNGVGMVVDAMKQLAQNMLNTFKSWLGINSPGYMYYAIAGEMEYIGAELEDAQGVLGSAAQDLGTSILDGFNSNDFDSMAINTNDLLSGGSNTTTPILNSGDKGLGASADMDVSINPSVSMNTTAISENITEMAATVNPQLLSITNSIGQLGLTSQNNTMMIIANNEQIKLSYQQLQLSLLLALQNINTTNYNAWTNIKQTTINNLNSILTSTKNVTTQMIQAWQTMKNSIIQAANDIKSQSEQRFNNLWNTIKTFYQRIQHPGGAGSPNISTKRRSSGGHNAFSSFKTAVQNRLNRGGTETRQTLKNKGFMPYEIEYLIPRSNGRVKTSNILNYINNLSRAGAGGWSDVVKPNVDWIRNTTNKWKTAAPTIVRYKTSHGFEVGDFEHGEPRISFNEFRQIAEDVFSQCHYLFYMDSSHYGHWIPAARAGLMNCDDSTEFLLAMARSFGFSGTKVHGYWNNIGHYWANIAGHKMDTTGWMNRRTWTPSASHSGPVPRGLKLSEENDNQVIIIEILQAIYNRLVSDDNINTMSVIHEGNVNYNFKHEIDGNLPDGLSAEDVVDIMNAHVEDSKFIKLLTGNREFMNKFERMYNKIRGEHERFS